MVKDGNWLQQHKDTHTPSNSWWINDAMGIPLARVCDECEEMERAKWRPEVLGDAPGYFDVVEDYGEDENEKGGY